jgi:pimeloyl-ACP methyl ester carboxylesterase
MPFYERGDARIHYEETGSGFPLFTIYGGGLNSSVAVSRGSFDAVEAFKSEYRCITMDLRNSNLGQSSGPLDLENPWDMHTDDQFGLLDHLGIDRFLVLGFCIGNPLIWNMLKRVPGRIVAAVSAQPSGIDPRNAEFFYNNNMGAGTVRASAGDHHGDGREIPGKNVQERRLRHDGVARVRK